MKIILLLLTYMIASTLGVIVFNKPAYNLVETSSRSSLAQDFKEFKKIFPKTQIKYLFWKYLLNDSEFQSIVRILNSPEAYLAKMKVLSQPEIIIFRTWVKAQLHLTESSSSEDSSEEIYIFNNSAVSSQTTSGWKGFVDEFAAIYPDEVFKNLIELKVSQNGTFTEFYKRLQTLNAVFERALNFPEVRKIIEELKALGVNFEELEKLFDTKFAGQRLFLLMVSKFMLRI